MKSARSRLKTVFWSLVLIAVSGLGFHGCVLTPIRSGEQTYSGSDRGDRYSITFTRATSPVGFWAVTAFFSLGVVVVFAVGVSSLIGGITGTSSLSIGFGDSDDDSSRDPEEDLQEGLREIERLRRMKPAKREKALHAYLTNLEAARVHARSTGKDPDPNEEAIVAALNDLIESDLSGMTEEEQAEYRQRIAPDMEAVRGLAQLLEKYGRDT